MNCSCTISDGAAGIVATPVTHSPWGRDCGCGCIETARVHCAPENCSCARIITPLGVAAETITHSPIHKSCGCSCEEVVDASVETYAIEISAVVNLTNLTTNGTYLGNISSLLNGTNVSNHTTLLSIHLTCGMHNCSCSDDGSPVELSPWSKDCGCGCEESSRAYCR